MNNFFKNKNLMITGGTGSFGNHFVSYFLSKCISFNKLIIFSRDEYKQYQMIKKYQHNKQFSKLRFFIGDVRDKDRLSVALNDVDFLIHAAALKQIDTAEYNPTEFINTNIIGSKNIIEVSMNCNIKKVIFLSTDKACSPANLYGATKLCSEKLFIAGNNYSGKNIFSVVRYGNVFGSRGSIVPLFTSEASKKFFTITDKNMTRFNISLDDSCALVIEAFQQSLGSEIFIPKLPSYKITDLAKAIDPNRKIKIIGIRPGEKIHEELINSSEPYSILDFKKYFLLVSKERIKNYKKRTFKLIENNFDYTTGNNANFLNIQDLKKLLKLYYNNFN